MNNEEKDRLYYEKRDYLDLSKVIDWSILRKKIVDSGGIPIVINDTAYSELLDRMDEFYTVSKATLAKLREINILVFLRTMETTFHSTPTSDLTNDDVYDWSYIRKYIRQLGKIPRPVRDLSLQPILDKDETWECPICKEHTAPDQHENVWLLSEEKDQYGNDACGHKLHNFCRKEWFHHSITCPLCRRVTKKFQTETIGSNQPNPRHEGKRPKRNKSKRNKSKRNKHCY